METALGRAPESREVPGPVADLTSEADPEHVARAICLRQLATAPRSRAQLSEAMARRAVPDDVAGRVLDRLTEVGLVDDAAFAEALVRSRHASRGLSRRALSHELRSRGVDAEVAAGAVDGLGRQQERETARRLAERTLRSTQGLDLQVRLRRVAGMLARRGYPAGLALSVVQEALLNEEVSASAGAKDADPWESSVAAGSPTGAVPDL